MRVSDGFLALLQDQLSDLGTVTARRMFSGAGVYIDGVIFALVIDDVLYLKTDEQNRAQFDAKNLEHFTFVKAGKTIVTGYRAAPEEAFEDRRVMAKWARSAYAAALRKASR